MNTAEKLKDGLEKVAAASDFGEIGSSIWDALKKDEYLRNTLGGAAAGGLSSYLTGADGLTSALMGGALGAGGTYYMNNRRNRLANDDANLAALAQLKKEREPEADAAYWNAFRNSPSLSWAPPVWLYNKYNEYMKG
jgi:hypothetical protein